MRKVGDGFYLALCEGRVFFCREPFPRTQKEEFSINTAFWKHRAQIKCNILKIEYREPLI
jgi:hypothetical protein